MGTFLSTRRGAIALVIAAALALALFVVRHGGSARVESAADASSTVPPQLAAGDGASPLASPSAAPADVVVYVCGAVKRAAVYHLPAGSRVIDAIAKAGGSLAAADLEQLNLAEPLADAMKIEVPVKGQLLADRSADRASDTNGTQRASRRGPRTSRGGSHKLSEGQTLDVNTASEGELTQLPGVGPGLARRIVEYRGQNGPFETIDDLQNVSGIGPSKFERLAPFVRL